ncbi:DUF4194 domain-containing protein [Azospirillum sp.]|uniref:DUF4194 domain-containing protein n=1 Tax=Azospirillum sp. TaxID=34012 RepID=UPI002D24178A|nr:DUF4194 domain-containing protein [Azospirillum sp.]HYD64167.1 DUF4194 domain-containing protein [Azospirillum sp.]
MLTDLQHLLDRAVGKEAESLEENLRATVRALWDRQFIYADDHGGSAPYELAKRYRSYFGSLFDAMGYDFFVEEKERIVGILDQAGAAPRTMRWDETLFLLALRILYEEKVRGFDLKERGRCDVTLSQVWNLVEERAMRKRPSLTRCIELVRRFQRHGLVRFLNEHDEDATLEIRPAIRLAMSEASLDSLIRYAQANSAGQPSVRDVPEDGDLDDDNLDVPSDGGGDAS